MIRLVTFICLALGGFVTALAQTVEVESDSGRYRGGVVDENPQGFGSFEWPDGDHYAGYWREGSKEGLGAFFFANDDVYVGDFRDDWIAGRGVVIWDSGNVFVGELRDGDLWTGREYTAEGQLAAIHEQGEACTECRTGTRNYREALTLDEVVYSGDTEKGEPHGQGTWRHSEGDHYQGEFRGGFRHGLGLYTYPDGARYLGEWREGNRTGFGVMLMADGDRYTGDFKENMRHGQGAYQFADGDSYVGSSREDSFAGEGAFFFKDGGWFAGESRNDKSWEGVEYNADGAIAGAWQAGQWCAGCQGETQAHTEAPATTSADWCQRYPDSFVCSDDAVADLLPGEIALGPLRLAFGSGGLDPKTFAGTAENVRVYEPGEDMECMVRHVFSRTRPGAGYPHIERLYLEGIDCNSKASIGTITLGDISIRELVDLITQLEESPDIAQTHNLFGELAIGTVQVRDVRGADDEGAFFLKEFSLDNLRQGVLGSVVMRGLHFEMFEDPVEMTLDLAEGRNLSFGGQSFDWETLRDTHLSFKGFSLVTPQVRITLAELGQPPILLTAARLGYALILDKLHLARGEARDSEFNTAMDELGIKDLLINSRFSIDGRFAEGEPRAIEIAFSLEVDQLAGLLMSIGFKVLDSSNEGFMEILRNLLASQEGSEEQQQLAMQALMEIGQQLMFSQAVMEVRDRGAVALALDSAARDQGTSRQLVEDELVATLEAFASMAGHEASVAPAVDQMLSGAGGVLRLTITPQKQAAIGALVLQALAGADVADAFDFSIGFVADGTTVKAPLPVPASAGPKLHATGSGFAVAKDGYLLTNQHVVVGCTALTVKNAHETRDAGVVAMDARNDIALLHMAGKSRTQAYFRAGRGVRTGDAVLAYGFPLQGLLADEAKPTSGIVNSLAGLENDSRFMQISAPVQSGNSGGPLLDNAGNVVGMVTSKLDAVKMMEIHNEIPQNINFAIKSSLLRDFLDANAVAYDTRPATPSVDNATIIEAARHYTYLIECWQ